MTKTLARDLAPFGVTVNAIAPGQIDTDLTSTGGCSNGRNPLIPNHTCVVSNLFDTVLVTRGGTVEAEWVVAARGKVR